MASNTLAAMMPGADLVFNQGKGLKKLFATPNPPQSPDPITTETKAVQEAAAAAAARRARARGSAGTILQSFLQPSPGGENGLKQTFGS